MKWLNIGEDRATTAKISVEIKLPSGDIVEEMHEFPLTWSKENDDGGFELDMNYTHLKSIHN